MTQCEISHIHWELLIRISKKVPVNTLTTKISSVLYFSLSRCKTELYKKLETKTLCLSQSVPLNGREEMVLYCLLEIKLFQ